MNLNGWFYVNNISIYPSIYPKNKRKENAGTVAKKLIMS